MARTPRTIELSSISTRFPLETRRWLEQRMKETGRQSLNEVINDLIDDARSWYRLPKPIVEVLDRAYKSEGASTAPSETSPRSIAPAKPALDRAGDVAP